MKFVVVLIVLMCGCVSQTQTIECKDGTLVDDPTLCPLIIAQHSSTIPSTTRQSPLKHIEDTTSTTLFQTSTTSHPPSTAVRPTTTSHPPSTTSTTLDAFTRLFEKNAAKRPTTTTSSTTTTQLHMITTTTTIEGITSAYENQYDSYYRMTNADYKDSQSGLPVIGTKIIRET